LRGWGRQGAQRSSCSCYLVVLDDLIFTHKVTAEESKMPVILWCYRYLWIRWVLYRENSIGLFRYREDRAMMEGATPLLAAALQGHTKVADWIGWCWQQPANVTNL
jgi:hypothetical protein